MKEIMKRIEEHNEFVKSQGYEILGTFLQGSQNYNLQYEDSDIDTKSIIIPSFKSFLLNEKPISETLILDNDEHADVKDIRLMFECFKKQNINFIEILFTKYKIINPKYEKLFQPLIDNNESVARYNTHKSLNCMIGMIAEKKKALKHPYPSTKDKIDKFGYDPKQLHHILRLKDFSTQYMLDIPYEKCLYNNNSTKRYLINVKKGLTHTLEEAEIAAKNISQDTYDAVKYYMRTKKLQIDSSVDKLFSNVLIDIMKCYFIEELKINL